MRNPFVFIVGCPRSGTTLLRRMVDAHPQLAVIPEVGWLARAWERREGLAPDGTVTPAFVDALPDRGGFGRYTPLPVGREELRRFVEGPPAPSYAAVVSFLFDRYGEQVGKPLVGNKTVELALSVDTLHEVFPQARFVHLLRDGRDVAASATSWRRAARLAEQHATWAEEPLMTAALWWEWHVRRAGEAGARLGPERFLEVRYESLVADPAAECGRICDFLGLAYDEAMVRFHEGRQSSDPGLDAKRAWRPPTRGLRDWRTRMAPVDVARIEAVVGGALAEAGYERSVDPGAVDAELVALGTRLRSAFEGRPLPARWGSDAGPGGEPAAPASASSAVG